MFQANSCITDQWHSHDADQRPCNHFQHAGYDCKSRKSHALNRKTHRIDQHHQTIARRRKYQKLIGIRNNLRIFRIQKEMRKLFSCQKYKNKQNCRDRKSEQRSITQSLSDPVQLSCPMFCPLYGAIVVPIASIEQLINELMHSAAVTPATVIEPNPLIDA